jgi:hypothetical protein
MSNQDKIQQAINDNNHDELISLLDNNTDLNKAFMPFKDEESTIDSKDLIKQLLKDPKVNPTTNIPAIPKIKPSSLSLVDLLSNDSKPIFLNLGNPIQTAAKKGFINIVETLLNNDTVDPTLDYNRAIIEAYIHKQYEVVELLWKDIRVKNTLQNDRPTLYKKLIKKHLKENITSF